MSGRLGRKTYRTVAKSWKVLSACVPTLMPLYGRLPAVSYATSPLSGPCGGNKWRRQIHVVTLWPLANRNNKVSQVWCDWGTSHKSLDMEGRVSKEQKRDNLSCRSLQRHRDYHRDYVYLSLILSAKYHSSKVFNTWDIQSTTSLTHH